MRGILILAGITFIFSNCDTQKSTQTENGVSTTASKRWNMPEVGTANSNGTDSLMIRGSSYIKVEGKSETGPELEGAWELVTMNGIKIPERSNLKNDLTEKILKNAEKANAKSGTEIIVDSVKTKDGVKTIATTYAWEKSDNSIKITPPQGGSFHIPQKPSLQFYGMNETFSGFTGCNKISGRYAVSDSTGISFEKATPSTKMVCIGDYNEDNFVSALHSVKSYKATKYQLELFDGSRSTTVLVFRRID